MPTERLVPVMIQRQHWVTVPKPSENGRMAPTEPTVSLAFARDEFGTGPVTIENSRPHHISWRHR